MVRETEVFCSDLGLLYETSLDLKSRYIPFSEDYSSRQSVFLPYRVFCHSTGSGLLKLVSTLNDTIGIFSEFITSLST